jgi:HEAT repeat protein
MVGQVGPTYQGRDLNSWLVDLNGDYPDEAGVAIHAMGTNAIPALLQMVRAKDSSFKTRVQSHLARFGVGPLLSTDYQRHYRAQSGFAVLGATAKPAVVELIRMLSDTNHEVKMTAIVCLGCIGPAAEDAVPALVPFVTNSGRVLSGCSIQALGRIHALPKTCVSAIMAVMESNPPHVTDQVNAMYHLLNFGSEAKAAVPLLIKNLTNSDIHIRAGASNVLFRIDADAAKKAGVVLTNAATQLDPRAARMRKRYEKEN